MKSVLKIIVWFLIVLILIGVFMTIKKDAYTKLENFDDLWSLGYPDQVEKSFKELLPQAKAEDKSIYLQILSQISLAQALQKKFGDAHNTLDDAERLLTSEYDLAKVRIFLERGRVFQQEEKIPEALGFFKKSFELSVSNKFDKEAINAAHMIAIVVDTSQEKIKWNQLAISMAQTTQDKKAALWLGSLYHNLGQNYLEEKQFENALAAFQKALEHREKEKYRPNIRVAKYSIARTLRFMNRLDEALGIQLELLKEYELINKSSKFDMPVEMFKLTFGLVYEELAEIYLDKSKKFASLSYTLLANDLMFCKFEPKRLERLKQIQ